MESVGCRLIFLRIAIDMEFHIDIGGIYSDIERLSILGFLEVPNK
jgi:hypothetical protein